MFITQKIKHTNFTAEVLIILPYIFINKIKNLILLIIRLKTFFISSALTSNALGQRGLRPP